MMLLDDLHTQIKLMFVLSSLPCEIDSGMFVTIIKQFRAITALQQNFLTAGTFKPQGQETIPSFTALGISQQTKPTQLSLSGGAALRSSTWGCTARSKTPNHSCSGKRKWDCLYYLPPNCYSASAKLKSKQQILTLKAGLYFLLKPGSIFFFF